MLIILDLNIINLNFDSREDLSNSWMSFSVTGNVSSWSHSNWILRVDLDRTYNVGETFSILHIMRVFHGPVA